MISPMGDRIPLEGLAQDALEHLHDLPYLGRHPLAARGGSASALQRRLLGAIATLRPIAAGGDPDDWRRYRALTRRYVDGLPALAVARELAVSRATYYRDHKRALARVVWRLREDGLEAETHLGGAARLPSPLTALIGRELECAEVAAMLDRARLVTLTGPPGSGKTRLALELATRLTGQFPGGRHFVSLAPVRGADMVPLAVAHGLGLQERGRRPPAERIAEALPAGTALLVLDNCEHVVAAAPFVAELLAACPSLRVLATSRVRLRLRGEREYPVPPLAAPELCADLAPERLLEYPSVRLFVERAAEVQPGFALTTENASAVGGVCARLDGLPLAIELAAARVKVLQPAAMVVQLEAGAGRLELLGDGARDLPDRQRTLRRALEWSHDLLDGAERRLLRRLGVFVGGFTLEAAAAVVGSEARLTRLAALVDNSLLRQEGGRFRLLETLREFALELLGTSDEAQLVGGRHAAVYGALAERAEAEHHGPEQGRWFEQIEAERGNLGAALGWFLDHDDASSALRLVGALTWFWYAHSHATEGRAWLARVLARADAAPTALRARALIGVGRLAASQDDFADARDQLEAGLEAARAGGDARDVSLALLSLGQLAREQGDWAAARAWLDQSLQVGDGWSRAHALVALGKLLYRQGDYAAAHDCFAESAALGQRLGDPWVLSWGLFGLGDVALDLGDRAAARTHLEASLAASEQAGNVTGIAHALVELGLLMLDEADGAGAREHLERSGRLFLAAGEQVNAARVSTILGDLARAAGDLGLAQACYERALAVYRAKADPWRIARLLEGCAALALARGQPTRAVWLLGAVESVRASGSAPRAPVDQAAYERSLASARAVLAAGVFEAAWSAGRDASLDRALDAASDACLAQPSEPTRDREELADRVLRP
jgi:predicted ATPase